MTTRTRTAIDRVSIMAVLQMAMWGYFLYGFGPSVPLLRDDLGVSSAVAGLHSTLSALGAIIAGATAPMSRRFGRGRVRWTGVALLSAGALIYIGGTSIWVTLFGALLTGTGGSTIVNTVNVSLLAHHGPVSGPRWTTYAHGLGATAGIAAPLLIGLFVALGMGWRPGFLLVPLAGLLMALVFRGARMTGDTATEAQEHHDEHVEGSTLSPRFWWILVGLLFGVAAEFCIALWSTDVVRVQQGLDDSSAALAFSGFLVGISLARWATAWLSRHLPIETIVYSGLVVMGIGLALLLTTTSGTAAFLSLFVIGLGNGPQYPFVISMALTAARAAADRASSIASITLGVTVASAPFLLGAASDVVGVTTAFIAVPIVVVASLACLLVARTAHAG